MCLSDRRNKTLESFRRTFVKAFSYRVIHYILHLSEVYLAIWLYPRFGHTGPVFIVAFMQIICSLHYIIHERIFARIKWGYKIEKEDTTRVREEIEDGSRR